MESTVCPGCHFRCAIERYQCGRGEKLHAQWAETGELPERRGPGAGANKERLSIPQNDRIMHMLHIVGIALNDLAAENGDNEPEQRVLGCLMRHERAASAAIIEGRTHLADLDDLLTAAQSQGLVAQRTCGDVVLYELSDSGFERARSQESQRKAAEAEFLSVLSDEEKDQLLSAIMKVLEPGFKRRGMR